MVGDDLSLHSKSLFSPPLFDTFRCCFASLICNVTQGEEGQSVVRGVFIKNISVAVRVRAVKLKGTDICIESK